METATIYILAYSVLVMGIQMLREERGDLQ